MLNILKRIKNKLLEISAFLFFEFWSFLYLKYDQFSMNFHDNSRKKIGFFFPFFILFRTLLNYLKQLIKTAFFEGGEGAGGRDFQEKPQNQPFLGKIKIARLYFYRFQNIAHFFKTKNPVWPLLRECGGARPSMAWVV